MKLYEAVHLVKSGKAIAFSLKSKLATYEYIFKDGMFYSKVRGLEHCGDPISPFAMSISIRNDDGLTEYEVR